MCRTLSGGSWITNFQMQVLTPLSRSALRMLPWFLSAVSLSLAAAANAYARQTFVVKPPPAWVRTMTIETDRRDAPTAMGRSSLVLDDNEIRVSDKTVERFYRYAQRIETTAGLEDLSQLKFYFEPSYQQLTIHFIRIHRGGAVIDALKPSEIKTIQQEEELDEQLYNGTFASVVFMNDLRVGDVVDYAYTVAGDNPVLGGRFADRIYLADDRAVQKLSVRLIWPTQRLLNLRNHGTDLKPTMQTSGDGTEYLWERENVPAVAREDSTPGWVEQFPAVDVSEFRSWDEVVLWALPLFKVTGANPSELTAKIEKWKSDLTTPDERLIAALRFTQDEIRYLGIELGRYSHQPSPPAKVFARRFGDCKDKSLLLATILNALGIDAAPALVSARYGQALDFWQASPFAFNHVIVQARLGGRTYWLDPTISFQRGGLESYYDPPYERALVLRNDSHALEKISPPTSEAGSTTVNEIYTVTDYYAPARFVVTTIYKGANADAMRYRLSSESLDELGKANLNYYANENPSIRLDGAPQIADDQSTNIITVREHYFIDRLWNDAKHYFVAYQIYEELIKPGVAKRSTPFAITHPLNIVETIEINLPQVSGLGSDSGIIADEALRLSYRLDAAGNRVRLEYSLNSLADHVSAEAVGRHIDTVERMRNSAGIALPQGRRGFAINTGSSAKPISTGSVVKVLISLTVVALLVIALVVRSRRKRTTAWGQAIARRPGETADSAIAVRSTEDIPAYLTSFKCGCGKNPYHPDTPPSQERFTYDGRRLIGVRMKCVECSRYSDLYFSPEMGEARAVAPAQ